MGLTMLAIVISRTGPALADLPRGGVAVRDLGRLGAWFFNVGGIPKKLYTFVQLFLVLWMMWELGPRRSAYEV